MASSEPEHEEEPFEFETEHGVIRNNTDYCNLIKYIVSLEYMRVRALKGIDDLALAQNKATDDPDTFIRALQNQELDLPIRQTIPELPHIDWGKYGLQDQSESDNTKINQPIVPPDPHTRVRGRVFTESKPETFNQLWSCEEQRRLEELLEIYPEEEVEARRYKKIAAALGTRTRTQVYSRIQKYFLKLAKLGLPVPGRLPKKLSRGPKDRTKLINPMYKKSTFFPELQVPVKMEDSNEPLVKEEVIDTLERSVVELLRLAKEQRLLDQVSPVWQEGVTCVGCQRTGFVGARWTDHAGTDYCTDCIVQLEPLEKLTPVRTVL